MTIPIDRRRPNTTLRAVRLSLHMSQSDFAKAVQHAGETLGEPNGCNKRLVQKWESGEHTICRPHYRKALERVTRHPYAQLGFADSDQVAATLPSALPVTPANSLRELLGGESVQADDTSERLRYALEEPGRADPEMVYVLESTMARLFDLEHHERAANLLPTVRSHLDQTAALLAGVQQQSLRRRLMVVGGQAAALAGALALEQGDAQSAHRYWDAAMAAARKAGDGPLLSCVLTYLSAAAAEQGDPMTAWQLVHTAMSHAGKSERARAWMHARAAQEAAERGEVGAALAELVSVRKAAERLRPALPGDDTPPWVRFVDSAYLYAMAANVYGRLKRHGDAYRVAQRAMKTLSEGRTKTRAFTLAEMAFAAAAVGNTKQAMQYAAEAAELAEVLEATQAMRRLRAVVHVLPKPLGVEERRLVGRVAAD